MIKKLMISSLVAISVIGIVPVAASAEWKEDASENYSWVENGVAVQDWKQIDGQWYNFDNKGIMKTGWMIDNGSWYYLWSNGTMASNSWLMNGDNWYYLDASGKAVIDSVVIGKREYDFSNIKIVTSQVVGTSASNINTSVSK